MKLKPKGSVAPFILAIFIGVFLVATSFVYKGKVVRPDTGYLSEKIFTWQESDGVIPQFTDITSTLNLQIEKTTSNNELRGGVAIVDINGDDLNDILVVNNNLDIFINAGPEGFRKVRNVNSITSGEIVSVGFGDVDSDGFLDILTGTNSGEVIIVWGGLWIFDEDAAKAEITRLPASTVTTAVLAGDLAGTSKVDILSTGYGNAQEKSDDLIFEQTEDRIFRKIVLPHSNRYTLAAEVSDVNSDGSIDIWMTRDVGWRGGPDSLYTKIKNMWLDIAAEEKTDLRVDAMDVTIADFNHDSALDAYVSDVGDNELLLNTGGKFIKNNSLGLLRIRPRESTGNTISSSWASGVADFNMDGRMDLLVVNGGSISEPFENKIKNTTILQNDSPAVFLQKQDGTYADVWQDLQIKWSGSSRGLSIGDIDGDGDADFITVNRDGIVKVYRNDTQKKSTVITLAPTCSRFVGSTLSIQGDNTNIRTAFPAHSFLGAHAPEFITAAEPLSITLTYKGKVIFSKEKITSAEETISIPCSLSL